MNIWFATNNSHKREELQDILGKSLKIPVEEGFLFNPEETGTTFCENALIKARALYKLLGNHEPIIADDSGLCVEALDGRPGVYSAVYGYTKDRKLTSLEQNIMLLDELGDNLNRRAYFVCTMVLLYSYDRFYIIQETLEGEIVKECEMRGKGGFGYDPIFLIPEYNKTLAELTINEKNTISHRAKAGKLITNILDI